MPICRNQQTMELHLKALPDLVLLKIFNKLSLNDCRHLSAAFGGEGPIIDLLRTTLKSSQLEELVFYDAEDFMPIEFFKKNDVLWPKIATIRLNVNLLKLASTAEHLRDLIQICSNLCALELEQHDSDADANNQQAAEMAELDQFLATLDVSRVSEVYFRDMAKGQIIKLPRGLEKCAVSWFSLSASPGFLSNTIRSLHISFRPCTDPETTLPLPILENLDELSLGSFTRSTPLSHPFSPAHFEAFKWVRVLRVQLISKSHVINELITNLSRLECLHVDLTKMSSIQRRIGDWFTSMREPLQMPKTLKEYHVHGRSVSKIQSDLWRCLFFGYRKHQALKTVTQDYHFHEDTMSKSIAPCLTGSDFQLLDEMATSGVFRDLYFYINRATDWNKIITLLGKIPTINHLYLFIWLYNELATTQIIPAMPKIATSIKLLSVNDNHFHYEASFNVLSSFTNVAEYDIHCDVESQFFQAC